MSAELKPCPFCGGPVRLERTTSHYDSLHGDRKWWGVVCRNTENVGGTCAIQQRPSASEKAAVERWNRRATPAPGAPGQETAVSWQVRRTDGSPLACWEPCTKVIYDLTLATGLYCGDENGPTCEVRALGVIAAQEAAAVQAVGAWQDIATAPRHTEVLVWRADSGPFIAKLTTPDAVITPEEMEREGLEFPDDFEEWFSDAYGWQEGSEKPTHWQPLPAGPAALPPSGAGEKTS